MNELKAKSYPMETNAKKSFEFSKELDGTRTTVRGREVENGWLICFDKEYKEGDEYKYEKKEYISKSNPLEKTKENEDKKTEKDIAALVSSMATAGGMLLVD